MPQKIGESWYASFTWNDPTTGRKARIREPARDIKQRAVTSKTGAQQAENRIRDGLASGALMLDARGRVVVAAHAPKDTLTLSGFRERYFADHVAKLKASSRSAQETIWDVSLVPAIGDVHLQAIDEQAFAKVAKNVRDAGRAPKTINNALSALRTALTLANEWGLRGPPPKVRWEKVPEAPIEWFDQPEIEKLVGVGDPMVTFALKTGLRLGELLALKWGDIRDGKVTVSRSVWWNEGEAHEGATKSGRIRVVPLPPSALAALETIGRGKGDRYVFTDEPGNPLAKGETKWPLWRACEAAGVGRCGWHKLRHSYVSQLVRAGVPLPQVQKLAGHARIEMTLRYTHVSQADLERAVSVLD